MLLAELPLDPKDLLHRTLTESASQEQGVIAVVYRSGSRFRISDLASTRPARGVFTDVTSSFSCTKSGSRIEGPLHVLTGVQCHHGLYDRRDLTAYVDSVRAIFALDIYMQEAATAHFRSLFAHKSCAGRI